MVDKTIPQLDPTITPAPTDLFGVRQSGDAEDKSQTRAQVHALVSGEHLIIAQVDEVATPTLAFGDGDSGFYEAADDNMRWVIAGANVLLVNSVSISTGTSGSFGLRHSAVASATNPTLVPNANDGNTGLGRAATDALSLIAGGIEMLRLVETGLNTTDQLIIAPAGIIGAPATPALAFGDGDTGWFELTDDELTLSIAGVEQMVSDVDGKLFINTLTGTDETSGNISTTTPGLVAIYGAGFDGNGQAGNVEIWGGYANGTTAAAIGGDLVLWGGSGGGPAAQGGNALLIGGFGDQNPGEAIVRGGRGNATANGADAIVQGGDGIGGNSGGGDVRLRGGALVGAGLKGNIIHEGEVEYESDVGLTADVSSVQGGGPITSSYNVYSTVANIGDAATLPTTYRVGHVVYIKNDGANSMDVFPASGDNLGQGVNTQEALPAGDFAVYLATSENIVWTKLQGGTA